jgi:hypothetical protein
LVGKSNHAVSVAILIIVYKQAAAIDVIKSQIESIQRKLGL